MASNPQAKDAGKPPAVAQPAAASVLVPNVTQGTTRAPAPTPNPSTTVTNTPAQFPMPVRGTPNVPTRPRPRSRPDSEPMVVVLRNKSLKGLDANAGKRLHKKVLLLHTVIWIGQILLSAPLVGWTYVFCKFYGESHTFAVLRMKYAFTIACIGEFLFSLLLIILGVTRVLAGETRKFRKPVRLVYNVLTAVCAAHLFVFLPLTGIVLVRYKALVYADMKMASSSQSLDQNEDKALWAVTQIARKCCGIESSHEILWGAINNYSSIVRAEGCCGVDKNKCTEDRAYERGCFKLERQVIYHYLVLMGLPLLAFELICVVGLYYCFEWYRTSSKKLRFHVEAQKTKKRVDHEVKQMKSKYRRTQPVAELPSKNVPKLESHVTFKS